MALSYYPDGNLREITEHRPPVDGQQTETTTIDRFEQYDDRNRPLTKRGELVLLNGADAGQRFQTSSVFSYY